MKIIPEMVKIKGEEGLFKSFSSGILEIILWLQYYDILPCLECSSVQFSHSVVSDSLRPHESQHTRPTCPSQTPGVHSDSMSIKSVMPSSPLFLGHPLLLLPPIPPSIRVFSNESALRMRRPKLQHHSLQRNPRADLLQNGLVGSPCSPRDSQESSPTP